MEQILRVLQNPLLVVLAFFAISGVLWQIGALLELLFLRGKKDWIHVDPVNSNTVILLLDDGNEILGAWNPSDRTWTLYSEVSPGCTVCGWYPV